jgi:hypothetical protein
MTEKHRNSQILPISLRTGKNPEPKSKSLSTNMADWGVTFIVSDQLLEASIHETMDG